MLGQVRSSPAFTSPEDIGQAESILGDAAARARHHEILDLAALRLDFDGVAPEIAMELLGLHIDNTAFDKDVTPEDVEIRRRVLYGSFCFDKIHSLYQGRPPTLQEADIQVPLVFNDTYEETEPWRPTSYPTGANATFRAGVPGHSVTTFTALCKLCFILGRALNLLYSFASFSFSAQRHLENLHTLTKDLQRFEADLPPHLSIHIRSVHSNPPPPSNILALHAVWQTLIIIVRRPFVAHGHLRDLGSEVTEQSWQECTLTADRMSGILRVYKEAMGFRRSPFLISYCAYIAATIVSYMKQCISADPNVGVQSNTSGILLRCLQFCMEVLHETQNVNTGITKAQGGEYSQQHPDNPYLNDEVVLVSLMHRLDVPYEVITDDGQNSATTENGQPFSTTEHVKDTWLDLSQQNLDMDALLRSFTTVSDNGIMPSWPTEGLSAQAFDQEGPVSQDVLYGLMSGGNLSGYDGLFRSHNL
ncbi:MAG: hypothetical protein CYPHOPRED_000578 [Cyphobasidiales sp. Tagirdzhanova-0007]|nr:MAG: hypothetical protein CYPHOPRED_000578 [Cyphobasidiales sp. Tagirdzhanova-0007]